ncbi:hypothetical protein FIC87_12615 [Eggerthella lenta]|uniref:tRNA nuclease CdiA C-terminal domain-containing protein n=1 Tax=Eggerthella lenta TaxID=84112 RepID=A0A5C5BTB6_EGGLN|nr:hypothetical protein [Eggerthella lenta]TNU89036.1 hypothetical protein FIC87_12615 [Eggerthella lenta]
MEIPRSLLDRLTREVNALSSAGQRMALNAIERAEWGTVAELRAIMCEAMEAICSEIADMSAARSAEFYDDVREACVGSRLGALADPARDPASTAGAVRALVQSVADTGRTDALARDLADRVDYEAKRAAGECVIANGARDPLKPRFARVPSGAETCPFCIMLASRGFVYWTERAAGSRGHYHAHCDCRIVPSFDSYYAGPSRRFSATEVIEGYDLDGLYRRYVQDLRDGKLNLKGVSRYSSHVLGWSSGQFKSYGDFSRFVREASGIEDLQLRCAVIEQEWPKTGLGAKYLSQLRQTVMEKRSSLMGDAFYEKPRAELEDHERRGVDHLLRNGIVPTVKREDPKAKANIDFEIGGELWEMKNVTNARSSVGNQLSRGRKKWFKLGLGEPARFVVTCEECEDSFESVCKGIAERLQQGERCIVLSEDGLMKRLP